MNTTDYAYQGISMRRMTFSALSAAITLLMMLLFLPVSSDAAPDWQIEVRVESAGGHNRIVIGSDSTATDGYDEIWDSYALLGGDISAYFPHPEWALTHVEYQRDIKAHHPDVPVEWPFTVYTSLTGQTFTLTWSMLNVPSNYEVLLINESNAEQTDMQLNSSYQFAYTASTALKIRVTESSACAPVRVKERDLYFNTLQEAYNAANSGETIELRDGSVTGNSTTGNTEFNAPKTLTIIGGYDCGYASATGQTTVTGNLIINNGSVVVENITLIIP